MFSFSIKMHSIISFKFSILCKSLRSGVFGEEIFKTM